MNIITPTTPTRITIKIDYIKSYYITIKKQQYR